MADQHRGNLKLDDWLSLIAAIVLTGFAGAAIAYPREARNRQHALMTGWGGPPICRSYYLSTTTDTTRSVTLHLPPGVTQVYVGLLAWGNGSITVTTSADGTGTVFTLVGPVDTGAMDEESAAWVLGGRPVTVASSASWAWADVDFTLTVDVVDTVVGALAFEVRPIHVPR